MSEEFMFRRFLVLVSAALVCVCVPAALTAAPEEQRAAHMRFQVMDKNGDGVIAREEWQGSARSFTVHDWNGDGRLSGEEVRIGAQRNTNWDQIDHSGDHPFYASWTAAGFQNLDHNRDGRISRNEWHYDLETFRRVDRNRDNALTQAEFLGAGYEDDRGDSFDDIDVNNNGRVERGEWHGGLDVFNDLDANRDGVLSRFEVVGGVDYANDLYDQFLSLDVDRNGAIGRDEWHWSLGSFDRRDLDRNNVLSRNEFAAAGGTTATARSAAATRTVTVNPTLRWTDTGIDVRAGDTIAFDASGTITMSNDAKDKANPGGSETGRRAAEAPLLNQLAGSLIARIGGVGPIFVGGQGSITAPASGRLMLGVNDDHLADNTGAYKVTVTRQPRS
jgi:Ca2+-binding EF-hand superfamily protein